MSDDPSFINPAWAEAKNKDRRAELYVTSVVHEVENILIAEIEKIEGHVPSAQELGVHGTMRVLKDGSHHYTWRGNWILTIGWGQKNVITGQKGTQITYARLPEVPGKAE